VPPLLYSGRMLSGSQLERTCSESLGLTWPERKAFVPAKAMLWHTAAPVVSRSSAGAAKTKPQPDRMLTGAKFSKHVQAKCGSTLRHTFQAECSSGVNGLHPAQTKPLGSMPCPLRLDYAAPRVGVLLTPANSNAN
jgi:hypothetical protein